MSPTLDLSLTSHKGGIIDGFTLEKNRWDSLPLDDLLDQALLDERDRKRLADTGYLG